MVYKDIIKHGEIPVEERFQDLAEELFRKDEAYKWQKEFRIALRPPTKNSPVFVEIGSIEDIAFSGNISELRE